MATLKEILSFESPRSGGLRLWPEGVFYKAYDCSAYLFVHELRAYRPKRKFYKVVGREVLSIGFPMSALPAILQERHAEAVDSDLGTKYIALGKPVEEQAFRQWAETVPPEEDADRTKPRTHLADAHVAAAPSVSDRSINARPADSYPATAHFAAMQPVPAPCIRNGEEAPAAGLRQESATPWPVSAHITAAEQSVLESLRAFALENASPMQCMMFVAELRRRLQLDAANGDDVNGQPARLSKTMR
ncbi:hypothetical protein IX307_002923 [Bacteroides pyogenes]|uniref:hypothetical protein n=1 Tax=Bacteroides pyogenes TaxID=310300 RepID=UPI001BA5516F|nr:hypothetical protein [Bacteroides pyogenes]MBR8721658.1 hypothetical protein [Bacteroides pyogenes]MBR8788564.1 hypothetical protein [Bacteroides pyogenes]MBR8794043.1 hypothetical protein [Bacteroides pyogenes]